MGLADPPVRRGFDQYANVRPVPLMPGVASPLANRKPSDINMLIVRENTEGEYSNIGGVKDSGTENERAVQESVFTRKGIDRILRYAFEAASHRRGHVTSATKSNGIAITMPYWDERFAAMAMEFPTIKTAQGHIDILSAQFVRNPQYFDVVVGSNLLGDILSDLGASLRRNDCNRAVGKHQTRTRIPFDIRTGAWFRARYLREENRQSSRTNLVRSYDARTSSASQGDCRNRQRFRNGFAKWPS